MNNIFIFITLCLAKTQEQWDIVYQSFQDLNSMDESGWTVSNNYNGLLFTTCNGSRLFGGFNAFGYSTIVSKHFSLPPHYKINFTFEFWKIDFCQIDQVYFFLDYEEYWTNYPQLWSDPKYSQWLNDRNNYSQWLNDRNNYSQWQEEYELCKSKSGSGWYEETEILTGIFKHDSESLIFIIYSYVKGGWGFRDFTLSIVRCSSGCLYCSDNDYNNCYQWVGILSLRHESIDLDGWMQNDNIQPATSKCLNFDLLGGQPNLALNDRLEKIIQNLSPHYKIQINFQSWLFNYHWDYNFYFQQLVDDQIYYQTKFLLATFDFLCGPYNNSGSISNIAVTQPHSSSQCNISMRFTVSDSNGYWGIRAFNIYLAKCQNGCDECVGPLKTEFTVCSSGLVLYNNICTNSPPMLLSQISTSQIKDLQSDDRIPIEINLLEVDQQINTQGNFTLSVKNQYKFLTIQVYVRCHPKTRINSLFQSNKYQDSYQYSFFLNCQQAFNTVNYNLKYEQRIIKEQEMIINTSDTQCVIYQVIRVIDELPLFVKILEIIIEDF
ncbi:unnamed protein product (macronuclear) [Paramecium tetraurelia]|uniref:Uncharacterized protein n=1 Tax=Paramecium tetraurelia TaxID=5888 RepID=A0ECN4_PARTE|nr:uncharacterized protein GSPATT00003920001 [Paramecium tetraurelia]CAK93051.1 unnamed protein product [Paramecium tetraurelia]|eukprot:XP_001460448.1 hypothetical protein (macronuclear) [Paramecium tetraurelia strain d4-2]